MSRLRTDQTIPPMSAPSQLEWLADMGFAQGWNVSAAHRGPQTAVVQARLRSLVPLIAALTLAWIPVDMAGLAPREFAAVWPARVALAAVLMGLWKTRERLTAHTAIVAFLWVQALGFTAIQHTLRWPDAALPLGYGLFPFVIAAQLAVFPLPWLRGLCVGSASVLMLVACSLIGTPRAVEHVLSDAWLLALILSLSVWGGHMQACLLVDLLSARQDASLDPLTGLANRRSVERRLAAERMRALRRREPLSVALLDLDHFKHVNDTWGHATGDDVLIAVARVLQAELRGADLAARFGGEEFLAILPATGPDQAVQVIERIRERISQTDVPSADGPIGVTTSAGVATLRSDETLEELIARADAALYKAKATGRNRCVLAHVVRTCDDLTPIA